MAGELLASIHQKGKNLTPLASTIGDLGLMQVKKVDAAFWEKFQAVSAGHEMNVKSCYE